MRILLILPYSKTEKPKVINMIIRSWNLLKVYQIWQYWIYPRRICTWNNNDTINFCCSNKLQQLSYRSLEQTESKKSLVSWWSLERKHLLLLDKGSKHLEKKCSSFPWGSLFTIAENAIISHWYSKGPHFSRITWKATWEIDASNPGDFLVNLSALPYITLSLVRKNNEEECDRRSGGRVNVWWANPRTSKCVTSLLDEWKCDVDVEIYTGSGIRRNTCVKLLPILQ